MGEGQVYLMDVKLAGLLLGAPYGVGTPLLIQEEGMERIEIVCRLHLAPGEFDTLASMPPIAIAAGNTSCGPAFVCLIVLREGETEGERQVVRFALNPQDADQMAVIRRFSEQTEIVLRPFDAALAPLGVKACALVPRGYEMVQLAVKTAEEAKDAPLDPKVVRSLPPGVRPFDAAARAIAQRIQKHLLG